MRRALALAARMMLAAFSLIVAVFGLLLLSLSVASVASDEVAPVAVRAWLIGVAALLAGIAGYWAARRGRAGEEVPVYEIVDENVWDSQAQIGDAADLATRPGGAAHGRRV